MILDGTQSNSHLDWLLVAIATKLFDGGSSARVDGGERALSPGSLELRPFGCFLGAEDHGLVSLEFNLMGYDFDLICQGRSRSM